MERMPAAAAAAVAAVTAAPQPVAAAAAPTAAATAVVAAVAAAPARIAGVLMPTAAAVRAATLWQLGLRRPLQVAAAAGTPAPCAVASCLHPTRPGPVHTQAVSWMLQPRGLVTLFGPRNKVPGRDPNRGVLCSPCATPLSISTPGTRQARQAARREQRRCRQWCLRAAAGGARAPTSPRCTTTRCGRCCGACRRVRWSGRAWCAGACVYVCVYMCVSIRVWEGVGWRVHVCL